MGKPARNKIQVLKMAVPPFYALTNFDAVKTNMFNEANADAAS